MINSIDDIKKILRKHCYWRKECLNMIAAENIGSIAVSQFLSSDLGHRYGTYMDDPSPSARNYLGNRYIAQLEIEAHDLAKKVFEANYVDFRPLGGEMAGVAVICGLTKYGDTLFETGDCYGGQKIATKLLTAPLFKDSLIVEYLPYDDKTHVVNKDKLKEMIHEKKPKLIIFGRAHILFPDPLDEVVDVAKEAGAYTAYDGSHVMGFIASKVFPNPLNAGVDILMGSTHKTIAGPQGGIILTRSEDIYLKARKGLYPTLVTNHHLQRIPALAANFLEMIRFGSEYYKQIVKNSKALGQALYDLKIDALYPEQGFSETHEVLVDVSRYGSGKEIANRMEEANIIAGGARIPKDLSDPKTTSGIRLGTQEVTRIGMRESEMSQIADLLKRIVVDKELTANVAKDVKKLLSGFNKVMFSFDEEPYLEHF